MPRIARLVCPGLPHHVTQRGNRRGVIFFADEDRQFYLRLLGDYTRRHEVDVLAYCLMTNHVHLVVVPRAASDLHRALRPLHMRYAQHVNRARSWSGHLWQGRYFSSALDECYLRAAIRYVERNPVRARMVERAEDYPWSSARARCRGEPDLVVPAGAPVMRGLPAAEDWSAWLVGDDDVEHLDQLRRNVDTGLPCGSPEFLETVQATTGRALGSGQRGRPVARPRQAAAEAYLAGQAADQPFGK